MSLTKEDLRAIKELIDGSIDERVPVIVQRQIDARVPQIVEKYVEDAKLQTAAGFEEVGAHLVELKTQLLKVSTQMDGLAQDTAAGFAELHEKTSRIEDKLDDVARIQQAEVERVNNHDRVIVRMRKALGVA